MKTVCSIAFISLLSLHVAGYYLLFSYQKMQVRSEMKQLIKQSVPETELTRIVISGPDHKRLQWKDRHEFRYRGFLYDIVRITEHGDTTIYDCISDTQETRLFSNLEDWVQGARDRNENGSFLVKVMQLNSLFPPPGGIPGIFFSITRTVPPPVLPDKIRSLGPDTPSPPPKGLSYGFC